MQLHGIALDSLYKVLGSSSTVGEGRQEGRDRKEKGKEKKALNYHNFSDYCLML